MKLSLLATSVLLAAVSAGAYAYTPDTYTAAIAGQNGPVKVEVTTSADKILSVKIIDQKETEGIGSKAVAALPSEIVKAQSADVQGIAGASVSSAAIKKAVQECLNQAQGKKAAPLALKNGTFEGKAYGNNGWLTVEVTIKDNKITDIKTPGQRETKYLGDTAIREIGTDVLQYQTLNVDNIAGATVTSTALKTAIAQAIEKAGGDIAAFQKPVPEKIKKVAGITKGSADLIIVGAGGAGLSAAVTAKDLGVKNVLVLEKMPVIGGNTLRCASAFNAADPDRQKALPMTETLKEAVVKAINEKPVSEKPVSEEHAKLMADVKAKYEAYLKSGSKTLFDCPEWHALQTYNGGDKVGQIPLIRQYSNNVLDTLHWMQSKGSPVMDRVSQGAGALWQRTHQLDAPAGLGLIDPLYQSAVKQGVNFKLGMRVQDLILNDKGRVIGVTATDKVGNKYEFTSKDGVILATGGYSQNKEMRQKSAPHLTPEMVSTNQPGATGDGIVIATRHGADTTGMNYVQVYPLATPGTGALQGRARKMSGLDDVIDVNKNGERFVKEDARRDEFVAAIKKQPGGVVYDINDSSIVKPLNSFNEDVETLVSIGRIYKADSLADLAKQLGMPADKLEATVAEFNKMVEAKNDPKFGRKLFDRPIVKPPFYATPRAPSIHHTMGGLQISTNAQVLDKNGKPIPGLYAAGEVTGGIHGSNRLGGNATADVLTFGRIAAKSAVAHK